jgi:hypothetical protein
MNEQPRLSDVLDRIVTYLDRFVWFQSDHQLYTVTLWIVLTYIVDYIDTAAMLWLTSPTRECGKSLVLDILEQLCRNPKASVNMSNAVLFRLAADGCTLMFDEVDNIFGRGGDEEQKALLNAAYRRGRTAMRMGGPPRDLRVEEFDVFAPVALAGIGNLPDTVASRCAPIRMQRKPKAIPKQRFRLRLEKVHGDLEQLRNDIESALAPLAEEIGAAFPLLPDELGDRQQDIWEPMLAIADAAGDGWEKWAREAAVALHSGVDESDGSIGIQLLADIRLVFDDEDRLATSALRECLLKLEEAPWGDLYGKQITARFLADKLKPFGIHSKTLRIGDKTLRGYEKAAFLEPWDRYLPATSATDTTTDTPQGDSPEAGAATVRNTNATPRDVADVLPLVAEVEEAESSNPAPDVAPVAGVSLEVT